MARVMIVFEDVSAQENDGRGISINLDGGGRSDCQDEPTSAELAAKTFYEFLVAASVNEIDSHAE